MMRVLAMTGLLAITAAAASGQEADAPSNEAAIETAVFDYFHGQGTADGDRLFTAFAAEHATMVAVLPDEGGAHEVRSWKDMVEVLSAWAAGENPPGGERDGEITHMHITDGRLATVHFRYTDRFYDALTLAKVNGEWKIIAKAFVRQ